MKAVKILGTLLLAGLLFLSLLILSVAFTFQSTALNPDMVAGQAEKIDIPALVRDVTEEYTGDQSSPEEELIIETVHQLVEEQEPWLKQELNSAIHAGYDFLLGKTDRLFISVSLLGLKQDVKESLWEKIADDPETWLPVFQAYLIPYIDQNLEALIQDIKSYLPPDLAELPIEDLQPLLSDLLQELEGQINSQDLPPETCDLLLAVAQPYFDDIYNDIVTDIPDEISIDSEDLPADTMSSLLLAQRYIGYFRIGFYSLIGFVVLLALGILLINRDVLTTCIALGIALTAAGALELAGVLFAGSYLPTEAYAEIPTYLAPTIDGFYLQVLSTARLFSIIVLAIGIVLLAIGLIYQPRAILD